MSSSSQNIQRQKECALMDQILRIYQRSAATLSWMGAADAVLLYTTRTKRKRRHPGKLRLCLRVALHAYGSLSLLMLF